MLSLSKAKYSAVWEAPVVLRGGWPANASWRGPSSSPSILSDTCPVRARAPSPLPEPLKGQRVRPLPPPRPRPQAEKIHSRVLTALALHAREDPFGKARCRPASCPLARVGGCAPSLSKRAGVLRAPRVGSRRREKPVRVSVGAPRAKLGGGVADAVPRHVMAPAARRSSR